MPAWLIVLAVVFAVTALSAGDATVTEDFAGPPAVRGWRVFGDASLYAWNSNAQHLEVIWDSSRSNSYFHLPLRTVLTRDDDFEANFDLRLSDVRIGITPDKLYTFPLALGFLNSRDAMALNFFRGAGIHAGIGPRNLVEFNYFPAFGEFAPTIAQVVVSTNGRWLYNHDNLMAMLPMDWYRIAMRFRQGTLTTEVSRNGQPYGDTQSIQLGGWDGDFRADTFSISSYNDAGQQPPEFSGSILAHGVVDNIRIVTPDPPMDEFRAGWSAGVWQVTFNARSNWLYVLERSADLKVWAGVSNTRTTIDGLIRLQDETTGPLSHAFYRVRAERP